MKRIIEIFITLLVVAGGAAGQDVAPGLTMAL